MAGSQGWGQAMGKLRHHKQVPGVSVAGGGHRGAAGHQERAAGAGQRGTLEARPGSVECLLQGLGAVRLSCVAVAIDLFKKLSSVLFFLKRKLIEKRTGDF